MKLKPYLLTALAAAALPLTSRAQLTIPGDGSDGALNVTADTVIDLSQAVTGVWNQNNTANAGKGVYDPEKWVIVFKYTSVSIAGHTTGTPPVVDGRKVTFINHPSHAPVVWLVQGDVNIGGIVSLDGQNGSYPDSSIAHIPKEPGPGGFRGGVNLPTGNAQGSGLGPAGSADGASGSGGYANVYGNPQILPLMGGSGGTGYWHPSSGPAGGGAFLIASGGVVNLNGEITCNGGIGRPGTDFGGAGGAIKIIAGSVTGSGRLEARHMNNSLLNGRIRIETNSLSSSLLTIPETVAVPPGAAPVLWPPDNAPKVRVVSVDAVPAPADPTAPLRTSADIGIQKNGEVDILIEAVNFPIEGQVQVRMSPKFGNYEWKTATRTGGNFTSSQWRVRTVLPAGFTTLQARATAP